MGKLLILADDGSEEAISQKRGKLFEKLMSAVLGHYGYEINDRRSNVVYSGMEIDIEGVQRATNIPMYAECKCYSSAINAPALLKFFGIYMTRWLKDNRSQGIFVALPSVNAQAWGAYEESMRDNNIILRIYQEENVIEAIFKTMNIIKPDEIARNVEKEGRIVGDWALLYTEKGYFWVQLIIIRGSGIPSHILLLDKSGNQITDQSTIEYLKKIHPVINDFALYYLDDKSSKLEVVQIENEEIVEVKGSSECFEYQFPASPRHFVGRKELMFNIKQFFEKILTGSTTSRGILLEANSGYGKSSLALSIVEYLRNNDHYAIAIDCRSASSSQFILQVADRVLKRFNYFDNTLQGFTISGFEGISNMFNILGKYLETEKKLLVIFLDQFESIFFMQDAFKRIVDLHLKVCDLQKNIILGYSWKSDLVGLPTDFPFQMRYMISNTCKKIAIDKFSDLETNALLDQLKKELKAPLRKDLRFFLSEFSQGYPWLLKRLCAHVKSQKMNKVPQLEIASSLLNVQDLFQEDLQGLTAEEEASLRKISKEVPISAMELSEQYNPNVTQSLISRGLLRKIGPNYDIYWDIFRDYLNSGNLPIQENFILRVPAGGVMKAAKLLSTMTSTSVHDFQVSAHLKLHSFYNVARDLKLLGIAAVNSEVIEFKIDGPIQNLEEFKQKIRSRVKERLMRNRIIVNILGLLDTSGRYHVNDLAGELKTWCPYISAADETWRVYARTLFDWIDFAEIAIFSRKTGFLLHKRLGIKVDERDLLQSRPKANKRIPCIQYSPIEKAAVRIVTAKKQMQEVDWSGFSKSAKSKALSTLEDIGFIVINRNKGAIAITNKCYIFATNPSSRPQLFAEGAIKMEAFSSFISLLEENKDKSLTVAELAKLYCKKLDIHWKPGTSEVNVKIMLNWAKYSQIVQLPLNTRKEKIDKNNGQIKLF